MLKRTWRDYLLIRSTILVLHAIGPVCTAYTATIARRFFLSLKGPSLSTIASTILEQQPWRELMPWQWYCVAEALFFLPPLVQTAPAARGEAPTFAV